MRIMNAPLCTRLLVADSIETPQRLSRISPPQAVHPALSWRTAYVIVWGPDADRRAKLLICLEVKGSLLGSDSHPMKFSAELAVLQRGNQRHASRYSNFVASAEWVGYRERK